MKSDFYSNRKIKPNTYTLFKATHNKQTNINTPKKIFLTNKCKTWFDEYEFL